MAKKYLLYIHEEAFEKEERKSELVNGLLETYYSKHPAVRVVVRDDINKLTTQKKPTQFIDATHGTAVATGPLNTQTTSNRPKYLETTSAGLCEHYQPKGQCLVKGCKFA